MKQIENTLSIQKYMLAEVNNTVFKNLNIWSKITSTLEIKKLYQPCFSGSVSLTKYFYNHKIDISKNNDSVNISDKYFL